MSKSKFYVKAEMQRLVNVWILEVIVGNFNSFSKTEYNYSTILLSAPPQQDWLSEL